jgi:hypothetical protein
MNAILAPLLLSLGPVAILLLTAVTPVHTANAQGRPTSVSGDWRRLGETNDQGVGVGNTARRGSTPSGSLS